MSRRWDKIAVPITDYLGSDDGGRTVTVVLKSTGKPLKVRRSDVEFEPGLIMLSRWLYERVFEKGSGGRAPCRQEGQQQ